ncbi:MAG: T9SS type A sorting domain-containing protein [Flavobacteriales bacterium]|nr:T9SS type A sorting domain-containing protein [Flavobacteriales bacterium]
MIKRIVVILLIVLVNSFSSFSQNWQGLGTGMNSTVRTFYTDTIANKLYMGGNFTVSDGDTTWAITSWDGVAFDSLGGGMLEANGPFPVLAITRYNGNIYAGGLGSSGLAKWDGNTWQTAGVNGSVGSLEVFNNELYVGGAFDSVGGIAVNGLAKWNDTTWSDVHALPNYTLSGNNFVHAIIMYQGELFVGGNFSGNGGENCVKWDGASWQVIGGGFFGGNADVATFEIYNNELYVGGSFHKADGNTADAVAKLNGNVWEDVGGGMTSVNATVFDLQVFNNELWAAGGFTMAGGVQAVSVAKWDNSQWCALGVALMGNGMQQMGVYNNELYSGCDVVFDNDTLNFIAKWAGGNFTDTCGTIVGIEDNAELESGITIYPNPNNGSFTIEMRDYENVAIQIFNVTGQLILQKTLNQSPTKFDLTEYSKGMYFIKVFTDNQSVSSKIIKN